MFFRITLLTISASCWISRGEIVCQPDMLFYPARSIKNKSITTDLPYSHGPFQCLINSLSKSYLQGLNLNSLTFVEFVCFFKNPGLNLSLLLLFANLVSCPVFRQAVQPPAIPSGISLCCY